MGETGLPEVRPARPVSPEEVSMKRLVLPVALLFAAALSLPALAGGIGLSGAHYNLNVIGLDHPKDAKLVGSDRHTIFVDLTNQEGTHDNIYLAPGETFQVCDGNATDTAYNCDGTPLAGGGKIGAVFQLPCNTNVDVAVPCDPTLVPTSSYTVYVAAITRGGSSTITTCATDSTGTVVCDTADTVTVGVRKNGAPVFNNVTQQLTGPTLCDTGTGICESVALFSGGFQDFFWQYTNNGLRLAQLRFYPAP
jgi:hypothetical protein